MVATALEHDAVHHRRDLNPDQRLQYGPQTAQQRLLVPNRNITPGQVTEKFAERPQFAEIDRLPSLARFYHQIVCRDPPPGLSSILVITLIAPLRTSPPSCGRHCDRLSHGFSGKTNARLAAPFQKIDTERKSSVRAMNPVDLSQEKHVRSQAHFVDYLAIRNASVTPASTCAQPTTRRDRHAKPGIGDLVPIDRV